MTRRTTTFLLLLSALIIMAGCSGDMVKSVLGNSEMKAKLMDAVTSDPALSGEMLDKLMANAGSRDLVVEKVLGNGDLMQSLMGRIARDQTMVDGVMNLAVQDSMMKSHLMSVLQGMQMMSKK